MHYLQEHSYTIPVSKALVKMPDGRHFIMDDDLPKISMNSEYMALPHQLIQNYLLHQYGIETIYNGMAEISFRKQGEQTFCETVFSFMEKSCGKTTDVPRLRYLTSHADKTIPDYSIINYDAPCRPEYMQVSCGAIIKNKFGEILLLCKKDENGKDKWDLVGGMQNPMEFPKETLRREVFEETMLDIPDKKAKLSVIDFTNGISDLGLLGTRIVFNIAGTYKLGDINIHNNPDTSEQFTDARFFSLDDIIRGGIVSRSQALRINNAIANTKPVYSSYANWMPLVDASRGKYK